MKRKWKKFIPLYIMAIPGLAYLFINNYLPMFGLVIAFKDLDFRKGIWKSPWAGLDNFKFLFRSKDALVITRNTLLYNLAFIFIGLLISITVAILLSEIRSGAASRIYQSSILIPYLMSWVAVSYTHLPIWRCLISGILKRLGWKLSVRRRRTDFICPSLYCSLLWKTR